MQAVPAVAANPLKWLMLALSQAVQAVAANPLNLLASGNAGTVTIYYVYRGAPMARPPSCGRLVAMADGAPTPDYARMARGELIRRLEHARRWGRETLASNRALAKQVEDLVAEVDDLRERLTELECSIERASHALGNVVDELEMGMIGEDEGGWDLAQRIRDEVGDDLDLGPGWGAELVEIDKVLRRGAFEDPQQG